MSGGGLRTLLMAAIIAVLAACGSARRGEPLTGAFIPDDPQVRRGEVIFYRYCHECHTGGEAGLGPALNNKPLPAFAIRLQVRRGFGAMPAFDAGEITDRELDELVAYVGALRRHGN